MSESLFLAIDQGGQSTRVAVYDEFGRQRICVSSPCKTTHNLSPQGEFIEQNPTDILQGLEACLVAVGQSLGVDVRLLAAAGFAGQGSSLLAWEKTSRLALTPVLSWQDVRAAAYLQAMDLSNEDVRRRTGLRLSAHFGASKMRWCLDYVPAVGDALKLASLRIGPIVSYLLWHLTGRDAVDSGHAQRTLLWNLERNQWDEQMLASFRLPKEILPSIHPHESDYGCLNLSGQRVPMRLSTRDQGASLFANGMPDPFSGYINMGTGAFLQRVSLNLVAPEGLLVSPLLIRGAEHSSIYAWEAGVNGAAAAISYMREATSLDVSTEQIAEALNLQPQGECWFLNAVGGLGAPYWRTDVCSCFSSDLSPLEKLLAWLESVVFQLVVNIRLMNELSPLKRLVLSGGLSQADGVAQRLADLTQLPVVRSDNADATLQGVGFLVAQSLNRHEKWANARATDVLLPQVNPALEGRFIVWQTQMQAWLARAT